MLKLRNSFLLARRWKSHKKQLSTEDRKKKYTLHALENFDDFYSSVFGIRWRSMRAALLTEHKYVALVNNFGDYDVTCNKLEANGAINIKSLVKLHESRLNQKSIFPSKSNYNLEQQLERITKEKTEREKVNLYPTDKVNCMLESASESNANLKIGLDCSPIFDMQRLVDPEYNSGGLYEFMPATKIKGMEDWIPESDHYKYYQTNTDFPLKIQLEKEFMFPENLGLYGYDLGNCTEFESPKKCTTGVLSHYLLDGASVLPPLFLDIKSGEKVLDACAAPGGKSLLMLQTLYPDLLVCNDVQESRINRVHKVMHEYVCDFKTRWESKRIILNQCDARALDEYNSYDKILVDVPCTADRHSLMHGDNNIFKPTRLKERLRIPELQAAILSNCLRLLRPGGSLVYSTCSLSPVQNDGVVHMALQQVFNEHNISTTIHDLSHQISLFTDIFKFENPKSLKYGQMVIPYLPANFGPMYFCKISRTI